MTNYCRCGCGEQIEEFSKHRGEPKKFKHGHHRLGFKMTERTKKKISIWRTGRPNTAICGKNNGNWKGDDIGITQLHIRIRKILPRPKLCPLCLLKPPEQLSNKTGIYDMNIKNWWYLCCKCHVYYDGTVNNLKYRNRI